MQTPQMLQEAMARRPWLRVVRMNRNGGQSAAFDAGFKAARGQIIATIDADLQNDPEEIARLLPMLDGYDMITGQRANAPTAPSASGKAAAPTASATGSARKPSRIPPAA